MRSSNVYFLAGLILMVGVLSVDDFVLKGILLTMQIICLIAQVWSVARESKS